MPGPLGSRGRPERFILAEAISATDAALGALADRASLARYRRVGRVGLAPHDCPAPARGRPRLGYGQRSTSLGACAHPIGSVGASHCVLPAGFWKAPP